LESQVPKKLGTIPLADTGKQREDSRIYFNKSSTNTALQPWTQALLPSTPNLIPQQL
jgi:hypothetical protein